MLRDDVAKLGDRLSKLERQVRCTHADPDICYERGYVGWWDSSTWGTWRRVRCFECGLMLSEKFIEGKMPDECAQAEGGPDA